MINSARRELADFLRSRRERITPRDVGLPDGRRRRTPGLRREEVAERAGIGVDWYVRLEQGRAVGPSLSTLDALARALCLDEAERAHLRALARPSDRGAFIEEHVPERLRTIVRGLGRPAYVTGRRWDLLAWNTEAAEILGFDGLAAEDRNILVYMLLGPAARRVFAEGWAAEARRMVAQFRAVHDLWAADPAFRDLIGRLRSGCPDFALWWESHDIRDVPAGRKRLHHPTRGPLLFEYATFQANEDPRLKLAIYAPV